jgi:hypothetical protein
MGVPHEYKRSYIIYNKHFIHYIFILYISILFLEWTSSNSPIKKGTEGSL